HLTRPSLLESRVGRSPQHLSLGVPAHHPVYGLAYSWRCPREFAAWPRPPRQRSGLGCSSARRGSYPPVGYTPPALAPSPAASALASLWQASQPPASAARHTPAATASPPPVDRLARSATRCG